MWIYAAYQVQRELYASLSRILSKDVPPLPSALRAACTLTQLLDMVRLFYWDRAQGPHAVGAKPLLHPATREVIAVRPEQAEVARLRLLVLGLSNEMIRWEGRGKGNAS